MPIRRLLTIVLSLAFLPGVANASDGVPRIVYWDGPHMARVKRQIDAGESVAPEALTRVRVCAEEALSRGPYSVMDKSVRPPSGDKHDYLSHSRYWWPDPSKRDGLPYIRRDGVVNRKLLAKGDRVRIGLLYDDVESLALAHFFFREQKFADHAQLLLRTWFVGPDTRMNPNLKYGQGVPGRADGRGVGIMDTRHFIRVLESVEVLHATGGIADRDRNELVVWFRQYLEWLVDSDLGTEERQARNNHGTWYDAQVVRIALFVGHDELAKRVLHGVPEKRLAEQITADGQQPHELKRTQSLHYCLFNLAALCSLARMGESIGIDLWHASPPAAGGIYDAVARLRPYVTEDKSWPHQQIRPLKLSQREIGVFLLAADRYKEPDLAAVHRTRQHDPERDFVSLLFTAVGSNVADD